ncbi:MAG: bifunctional methylenetetrahydrofolate dehydrogenase/methenyltetrahydrofolate cyclohydrolase FolD [Planctomycetaceae bacterium]|nr:bifunctional methylenetetrahydrofolate dehydrogenase/methenyltetrahydrofolate cyclohydrolase FolD [Planctomycetaceae bacterium]MBN8600425.1 bifunctional methylenetetrahydrofolate dehydrogenase/methenyltetrahydrofolate cyclohydrolase FolD [Planctomycetota bacterium]
MSAMILDGKAVALQIQAEIAAEVTQFRQATGVVPCLVAVLVGDNPASEVYVRNKQKTCEKVGMTSRLERLPSSARPEELLQLIGRLNADVSVHGILVQLPLPTGWDTNQVLDAVSPAKDVDAFGPENVGLICQGRPRFLPCTPHGVLQLLARYNIEVSGKHAVVVGRSDIVGKPLAMLLMQRTGPVGDKVANATVTVCHSQTKNLAEVTQQADILIVAIGRANAIKKEHVKAGAVVIDVGINRIDTGIVGDVDFESVSSVASAITPVPGGVGPLTIAMLLKNTLTAAMQQNGVSR